METLKIKELADSVKVFDLLIIKQVNNLRPITIEHVTEITQHYIKSKNFTFLKSNFFSCSKNKEDYKIDDIINNCSRRVCNILEKDKFEILRIKENGSKQYKKFLNEKLDFIIVHIGKNTKLGNDLIIKYNSTIIYIGMIISDDEFKYVYNTLMRKIKTL